MSKIAISARTPLTNIEILFLKKKLEYAKLKHQTPCFPHAGRIFQISSQTKYQREGWKFFNISLTIYYFYLKAFS
jgi:hypothetical protein